MSSRTARLNRAYRKQLDKIARKNREITKFRNFVNDFSKKKTISSTVVKLNTYRRLTPEELFTILAEERTGKQTVIKATESSTHITLSEYNLDRLLKQFEEREVVVEANSWEEFVETILGSTSFEIIKPETMVYKKPAKKSGGFFKYLNKTHFNFERYGIFTEINKENYRDNCLFIALKHGGMSEDKLNHLKLIFKNRHISFDNLKKFCIDHQVCLVIRFIALNKGKQKGELKTLVYGEKTNPTYKLGLVDDHYFIDEKVDFTKFCLVNYNEVKDNARANMIYGRKPTGHFWYDKVGRRYIDSVELVKVLLEHSDTLLKDAKIDSAILTTQYFDKFDEEITELSYDETLFRQTHSIEYKERNQTDDYQNIFFDTETNPTDKHEVYMICSIDENDNEKSFNRIEHGPLFIKKWLNSIKKSHVRLIAHNAGYDYRFIFKYFTSISNEITRGNNLLSASAIYFNNYSGQKTNFIIINSLNLLSMPLRDFKKSFDKDYYLNKDSLDYDDKQVMNYLFYNKANLEKRFCDSYDFSRHFNEQERKQFKFNLTRWNLLNDAGDFDIIGYSREYCMIDCRVLKDGWNTFKTLNMEVTGLSIDNYVSLASNAHTFMIKSGCFDGCFTLSGVPQQFIGKCVVGGRTMSAENKKHHLENTQLDLFDACSLYPSAMYRMPGYLKGLPKVILPDQLNYEFLKQQDGYFVQIEVTRVGIRRAFPLASIMGAKTKIRTFTNDIKFVHIDKTGLEDLIMYQDIDFKVIRGYYFNEGRNNTINEVIKNLYETRNKKKKEGNPIQLIYKLLMNSSYGRTILKPIEFETKIFKRTSKFNAFLSNHYNEISEYTILDGTPDSEYCIRRVKIIKSINDHHNIPHVGVEILSWSKRIMNEVICLAEDNHLEVFYQDTDSIHMLRSHINELARLFNKKYGRDLIGKNMGQFHSDFPDWQQEVMNTKEAQLKDIYAIESIVVGKKTYCDVLVGTDIITGEQKHHNHYRLKGINYSAVDEYMSKNKCDARDIFKELYVGKSIKFNLSASDTIFKFNKDYTIDTNHNMVRTIHFN